MTLEVKPHNSLEGGRAMISNFIVIYNMNTKLEKENEDSSPMLVIELL